MEEDLEPSSNYETTTKPFTFSDDIDSAVSTPYVSAPSSPGREPPHYGGGFFYSAPASPIHHILSSSSSSSTNLETAGGSFEFELATGPAPSGSMSSADELFLNGQIRPMKLSSHLQRPQELTPLIDISEIDGDEHAFSRSRDLKSRDRRRRARSMSPLRSNTAFQWLEEFKDGRECTELNEIKEKLEAEDKQRAIESENDNETPSSGASSRSSSVGRSSKRWVFLKEFLYRSKSEGRNSTNSNKNNHKFWSTLSLKKSSDSLTSKTAGASEEIGTATAEVPPPSSKSAAKKSVRSSDSKTAGAAEETPATVKSAAKKAVNGVGVNRKRRGVRSAHEMHYTMNRAQAEEMRKKTYLPYRQGLLGCLGFNSKGYGAMHGFARALNPVSSR